MSTCGGDPTPRRALEHTVLAIAAMRSRTRDATPPAASAFDLAIVDGDRVVTRALPATGTVSIGRDAGCDIQLDDGSVSRRHALLHLGEVVAVEDLGSRNRTVVGGDAVAAGQRRTIAPGEPVRFGNTVAVVTCRPTRPALTPAPPSAAMQLVHDLVDRVAPSAVSVLILGETGVGKEVLAERIHRRSPRAALPLVRLHCAAMPESLLESELFGHERGAFTGASAARPGLLASAHGGTVFLDEIGELPAQTQIKLLRVLEARQVTPLGGDRARPIDVRFLAATNRDLDADVARGSFRADLLFRLEGMTIVVPPLRERRDEIDGLAAEFIAAVCRDLGRSPPRLTAPARERLHAHAWPGNVRELRNVIERAVLLAAGDAIGPEHVIVGRGAPVIDARDAARRRIAEVLDRCGGNQTRAARMLGIGRRTLVSRLDELGLPRPRKATR